jgi:LPS sulfotransferase NodH
MALLEQAPNVLNFIVTGQVRCGAAVIESSVASHPQAWCHGELLGQDIEQRKEAHEAYFGENEDADIPDYCYPQLISPEQYLTTRIFDNAIYGEQAVGVKILYDDMLGHQLWEYFQDWCRMGDFCVIHIKRNPVACYVSLKQAQQSGVWSQSINDRHKLARPRPVNVDVEELTRFVRNHAMCEAKVTRTCDDRLEIDYKELFLNYPGVMAGVFDFLSLPPFPEAKPKIRRLKNRNIRDRISNFSVVERTVPHDVRLYFEDDLF